MKNKGGICKIKFIQYVNQKCSEKNFIKNNDNYFNIDVLF